jgi:hypothetical protein
MIAVVRLNPALDVTHHVPAADWAGEFRPGDYTRALDAVTVEAL